MTIKLSTAIIVLAAAGAFAGAAGSGGAAHAATTGVKTTWNGAAHAAPPATIRHDVKGTAVGADQYGCDSGWVCIMDGNLNIVHAYFTYGAHNIENPYLNGSYFVDNNQTDHAKASLCTGFNGTGCTTYYPAPHSGWADMTPFNSVDLEP
jgi:hypothetical protein